MQGVGGLEKEKEKVGTSVGQSEVSSGGRKQ